MKFTFLLLITAVISSGYEQFASACITASSDLDGRSAPKVNATRTTNVYLTGDCINGKTVWENGTKVTLADRLLQCNVKLFRSQFMVAMFGTLVSCNQFDAHIVCRWTNKYDVRRQILPTWLLCQNWLLWAGPESTGKVVVVDSNADIEIMLTLVFIGLFRQCKQRNRSRYCQ